MTTDEFDEALDDIAYTYRESLEALNDVLQTNWCRVCTGSVFCRGCSKRYDKIQLLLDSAPHFRPSIDLTE